MQSHKIRHGQGMLFPSRSSSDIRPAPRRNGPTVLPLLHGVRELVDLPGKTGERIPEGKQVLNCLHRGTLMPRDNSSRQVGSTCPVPKPEQVGTMSPMGRGTSPARFKKEFCARLRVARIAARYEPEQVADLLGVAVDTWRRYEVRTLLPHHLLPRVCELFGVTVDFFYAQPEQESRRA